MSHLPRRIVASALMLHNKDHINLIIVGVRHFDSLMIDQLQAIGYSPDKPPTCTQGFVDNDRVFLHRDDAWNVALEANQIHIMAGTTKGYLHSEDLW